MQFAPGQASETETPERQALQVSSVRRAHDGCILVEVSGGDEVPPLPLPAEMKALQPAFQAYQTLLHAMRASLFGNTKVTLCLSDEEYERLGKPTVGDEVELEVSERAVTLRFRMQ
jgi:hypothetical protein